MRVQFDLRPVSLLERERKQRSFNITRLLAMLLFLIFLGSSSFYVVTMTLKVISLKEEIDIKEGEVSGLEGSKQALEAEIRRLKDKEKVFADTLKIMQDDLPTLEVLNALEVNMIYGMAVNSLKFNPGRAAGAANSAVLDATAATEEQIIEFTNGLTSSGVFSGVAMPTSKRDEKTGRVSFALNLELRPIGQINPSSGREGGKP